MTKRWLATIHNGAWEVLEYTPTLLGEIHEVVCPADNLVILGTFASQAEAVETCLYYIVPDKRSCQTTQLQKRLLVLRRAETN